MVLCRDGSIELTAAFYVWNMVGGVRFTVEDSFAIKASFESGDGYTDRECLDMAVASFDRLVRERSLIEEPAECKL